MGNDYLATSGVLAYIISASLFAPEQEIFLYPFKTKYTESQNGRGWKGPLGII